MSGIILPILVNQIYMNQMNPYGSVILSVQMEPNRHQWNKIDSNRSIWLHVYTVQFNIDFTMVCQLGMKEMPINRGP